MDLLDNSLIRKYFGCKQGDHGACDGTRNDCMERTAFRVLAAMQEQIKKGERILWIFNDHVEEEVADQDWRNRHMDILRLPSRFQTPEKKPHECNCEFCGSPETVVLVETPEERARRTEGSVYGVKVRIDDTLKPGEWFIMKGPCR